MNAREKCDHNRKFIMRYSAIHHSGVSLHDILQYTDNKTYAEGVLAFRRAFPDYIIMIEDLTSEGDFVILHGVLRGTHEGSYHGIPPTYRKVELPIITKFQIVDDKIINAWPLVDTMVMFEQLGVNPYSNK